MGRWFEKLLPRYAVVPLASCLLVNFLVYFGNRLIPKSEYHDIAIPFIDGRIPFWTWMIVIYVFFYVFWAVGLFVMGRESKEVCYFFVAGSIIAKLICLVFFLAFPTEMVERPSGFEINSVFDWLTQVIYDADEPNNLFPSVHCLETWVVFRSSLRCKKPRKWYRVYCFVMMPLIFASTLLVKQHVVADVIGGVLAAEAGFFLARKLRMGRLFEKINQKLFKSA